MEIVVTIGAYLLVFGAAAVLSVIPAVIAYFLSKKKLGKGWSYFAGLVVVLCILAGLSREPLLFYTRDCPQNLSAEQEASVRSVSSGVYSKRLPLVPVVIRVRAVEQTSAAWTEYYFPIGNREMELTESGFNCTKPLR